MHRSRALLAITVSAVLASCVTRTSVYYRPDPADDRLRTTEATEELEPFLRAECPRLSAHPSGEASVTTDVATDGRVTRAALIHSSGDAKIDGLFGAMAAKLQFDPVARPTVAKLRMGYSCGTSGSTAAVATIEIISSP